MEGSVKWFNRTKGFGFIEGEDGEDYFLNIANVRKGQTIQINSQVKFDVNQGQRGLEAVNVTLT